MTPVSGGTALPRANGLGLRNAVPSATHVQRRHIALARRMAKVWTAADLKKLPKVAR